MGEDLHNKTLGYDVSILVNNVGMVKGEFDKVSAQDNFELALINCFPQFMLTKLMLDRFKERGPQSAIVDLSSIASFQEYIPTDLYGTTKSFNRALTQCLNEKYSKSHGIDFLTVKAGVTLTEIGDGFMTKNYKHDGI